MCKGRKGHPILDLVSASAMYRTRKQKPLKLKTRIMSYDK